MKMKKTEVLGIIAGAFTTGSFVPQVWRLWKHVPHPASDISLWMFSIMSIGILLWAIYGWCNHLKAVIVANATTFILSMAVVAYKLLYG